jgi:hypothetical protein
MTVSINTLNRGTVSIRIYCCYADCRYTKYRSTFLPAYITKKLYGNILVQKAGVFYTGSCFCPSLIFLGVTKHLTNTVQEVKFFDFFVTNGATDKALTFCMLVS